MVKIMENGVVRNMTAEEEAEFIRQHENTTPPWEQTPTTDDIINTLFGGGTE